MSTIANVFLDAGTLSPLNYRTATASQLSAQHFDIDINALLKAAQPLKLYQRSAPEQLIERAANAEIIISNKVYLSAEILAELPQLRLICVAATGVNNVDLAAARKHQIAVCNVAGYSTDSVVQLTLQLILQLNIGWTALQHAMQNIGWENHNEFVLLPRSFGQLRGKTLTIIGYGTIGKAVASVAKALGMTILIAQLPGRPARKDSVALATALTQSDFVSLHCPLTEQTEHLVNSAFLAQLKPNAILINTARGGLIDEAAVARALNSGQLAGFGADVLSQEPPAADNPLLTAANTIITPHIGWASMPARQTLVDQIAANIQSFHQGELCNRIV
ncbi:MAG: D-2-hydroxyacid dehydrogenase [Gammaproteobacteria bacterium]|nr:D-2-hydroxyacid dehydrogenase [Gammaproteobacteria bacterium]